MGILSTQPLLPFTVGFVVAPIVSILVYIFTRALRGLYAAFVLIPGCFLFVSSGFIAFVCRYIVPYGLGYIWFLPWLIAAIALIALSFGGAFAEKSVENTDKTASFYATFLVSNAIISIAVGALLFLFLFDSSPIHSQSAGDGYFLGLLLTPPIIPFLWWIWKISRLRLGIDKHFDE